MFAGRREINILLFALIMVCSSFQRKSSLNHKTHREARIRESLSRRDDILPVYFYVVESSTPNIPKSENDGISTHIRRLFYNTHTNHVKKRSEPLPING